MSALHLVIDLRIVDAPGMEMTGAGRYALETTRALQRARPQWRFSLMSNRDDPALQSGDTTIVRTRLPTDRAPVRVMWLHTASALAVIRQPPDVWFSPSFVLPFWWTGPSVVTVHDLTFLLLRHRYRGRVNAWYATTATRRSARQADCVLCGSNATRELLRSALNIDSAKVRVIPYGVSDVFFSSAEQSPPTSRSASSVKNPYVLFVGTREARKGLATLRAAVDSVNDRGQRVRLLLAGQDGWGTERLLQELRGNPSVEFWERPDDAQLATLYRGALAVAYPSEMEGFGIPVAEAMASGSPVIASDLPSIREFADDYPLYIDVGDHAQLAAHIETLLNGEPSADEKRVTGRQLASALSWRELGEQTATAIELIPKLARRS